MQKKVIVLAIAAALSAPAVALAGDTSFYGQLNMSVDMVKSGAVTNGVTDNQLNSNSSRLGLKNSEDLGNGMSAVVQLEGSILGDTGGATLFDRNSYLGLNSSAGLVFVGRHDTPYKIATRKLDMFADGIADNRGNQSSGATLGAGAVFPSPMMGGGHDARLGNVLAYVSPNLSGLTVAAATVFGAESAAAGQTKASVYSLAGMYEHGPIYAALAYQTVKVGDAGSGDFAAGGPKFIGTTLATVGDKATATKLGGGYTADKFAVNAVVEKLKDTLVATDKSRTDIYLAGKFNITGTDAVKLAYTKIGDSSGTAVPAGTTDGSKQTSLGYDHGMSKQTTVYALYTKVSQNATSSAAPSALSVGMRHSF